MVKRIGMIVVSIAAAVIFTMTLSTVLKAWAADGPTSYYECNVNPGVQCSLEPAPSQTNTTLTTTQILTTALPTSITIRITTTSPIAEFDLTFGAIYAFDNLPFTNAVAQIQTNRTARITIPITSVAVGQTQTKVFLAVFSNAADTIGGNFVIRYPRIPSIPRTGPYTVTMPILYKNYCQPLTEVCLGSNETFAEAPEIKLASSLDRPFTGTLNQSVDPRDYYRVTFIDTRPYTISLNALAATPTESDLDLFLFDSSQKLVCQSSFVGNSNEQIRINVLPCSNSPTFNQTTIPPGSYTLLVRYSYSGSPVNHTVPYTLTINT